MTHSIRVNDMLLRINWTQIRGLKEHLARQGFHPESELMIMTLYRGVDPVKTRIKFENLQNFLFEIDADPNLIGVFVFDSKSNKPLWSAKAAEREESLESIPTSGHPTIVTEFKNMKAEQKQVWIDITTSAIQSYLDKEAS